MVCAAMFCKIQKVFKYRGGLKYVSTTKQGFLTRTCILCGYHSHHGVFSSAPVHTVLQDEMHYLHKYLESQDCVILQK